MAWAPAGDALAMLGGPSILYLENDRLVDLGINQAFGEIGNNYFAWAPDGRWLAYSAIQDSMEPTRKEGMYFIDTSCFSEPTTCRTARRRIGEYGNVTWSPDSQQVALAPIGHGDFSIHIIDAASGKVVRKLSGLEQDYIEALGWSPDGELLAIDYLGKNATYLLKADGSQAQPTLLYDTSETDSLFVGWLKVP